MKKILIAGKDSYIGTRFETYIRKHHEGLYTVDTLDMIGDAWRETDLSGYDTVFYVAGIAHRKETKENAHLYYEVNRDLTVAFAARAKACGVRQFIFLSSMSVYGMETGVITSQTPPAPKSHYGRSKWQAEEGLAPLQDDSFRIAIVRPPMVYGEGCKGNYQSLVKLAKHLPFFPSYQNQRSMIHVDRLAAHIEELIASDAEGVSLPQDEAYVSTARMVKDIAKDMGKDIKLIGILNPLVFIFKCVSRKGKKAFGSLIYQPDDAPDHTDKKNNSPS